MRIAIVALPGVQMLDLVGPMDVFREAARQLDRPDAYTLEVISGSAGPEGIRADNGLRFLADASFETASTDIDTLLVAGSPSICALEEDTAIHHWLIERSRHVRRLGSVCSGVFLLAHAGLLDGRRVTTHWNSSHRLAQRFPQLTVEMDQIYVRDGMFYTSAGVTAGMDLALALVEEDFGRGIALKVARELVMFLKRPGGQSQFSAHLSAQTAQSSIIRDIQDWVLENLDKPLTVDHLAERASMSVRNFSRHFRQEADSTPAEFVETARLDSARRLLEDTRTPLKKVAAMCGFADPTALRRAFVRRMRVSPADYRRRFSA